jgi:hypothetical protein
VGPLAGPQDIHNTSATRQKISVTQQNQRSGASGVALCIRAVPFWHEPRSGTDVGMLWIPRVAGVILLFLARHPSRIAKYLECQDFTF